MIQYSQPPQTITTFGQSNPIRSRNYTDADGNPSSGYATGPGLSVIFQDGPRGKLPDGTLAPANAAFVEDLLVAAYQRLQFFQESKYKHDDNGKAMNLIAQAINALGNRAKERAARGVLGLNKI